MFKFHSSLLLVIACVACGSSFTANGDSGGADGLGKAGEGSAAGPGTAGSSSGGADSEDGGGSGGAGYGRAGTWGWGAAAGRGGWGSGRGGASDTGGAGGSAAGGSGGAPPVEKCTSLREQYSEAVEKARVCNANTKDECSASSTLEAMGCGCPILVNPKSEYVEEAKKIYQAYQDAKCVDDVACAQVLCAPILSASCARVSGSGTYMCTNTGIAN